MRMVKTNSSAVSRIGRLMMALTVVILAISGYAIFVSSERVMRAELQSVNTTDLESLSELYESFGLHGLTDTVTVTASTPLGVRQIIGLFTLDGTFIAGDLQTEPPVDQIENIRLAHTQGAPETVYVSKRKLFPDAVLYVGRPSKIISSTLENLGVIMPITASIILLMMVFTGAFAARILSRLMDRIQTTLAAFGAGETTRRIALGPDFDDRFHDVSVSINDNLNRIETATQTLENTTIAIAHDLRTPLTRASLALQAFQANAKLTEAESEQLDLATSQMATLSQTFDTILRISNVGAHTGGAAFATFDLNDLVQDIAESYAPVLEDAGFALIADRTPPVPINADKNMLGQLIVNLLTNIMRHCPIGSTAHIDVSDENGPRLCIRDNGPGVPDAAVESIFQPFQRLDVSRSTEGTGLGLAMVMAIAKHHGASIITKNLNPGLSVTICFQKTV